MKKMALFMIGALLVIGTLQGKDFFSGFAIYVDGPGPMSINYVAEHVPGPGPMIPDKQIAIHIHGPGPMSVIEEIGSLTANEG